MGKPLSPEEWISARRSAAILKICRVRKFSLLVRAKLLTPKHGKFFRPEVEHLSSRGVPTLAELRNLVASVERPPRQRRRRADREEMVRLQDWRPPKL